jgi:hypothetical protein
MKVASFTLANVVSYGMVTDNGIVNAGTRLKAFPTLKALLAKGSLDELKLQGEQPDYVLEGRDLAADHSNKGVVVATRICLVYRNGASTSRMAAGW